MTIHLIAAEIVRKLPEMAKDSPINNCNTIEKALKQVFEDGFNKGFLAAVNETSSKNSASQDATRP